MLKKKFIIISFKERLCSEYFLVKEKMRCKDLTLSVLMKRKVEMNMDHNKNTFLQIQDAVRV